MKLQDYDFYLPEELIASKPPKKRGSSRLLVLDQHIEDKMIEDFEQYLNPGDILVLNDTKVLKARLNARKKTGGSVEVLIERLLTENYALAQTRSNRKIQKGETIKVENSSIEIKFIDREGQLFKIEFSEEPRKVLDLHGKIPLPPYIKRIVDNQDEERYQTVYAKEDKKNSVAAPTAGLHFTKAQLSKMKKKGIDINYITLDIGLGTFGPIRNENFKNHLMHSERVSIDEETANKINIALDTDSKIIAIGTTVLRCLESVYKKFGKLKQYEGETDLFIYPGYKLGVVDTLLTNFHLPKSSLFLLVCAFGGTQNLKLAYNHAIDLNYKFFSYGDAMLINRLDEK